MTKYLTPKQQRFVDEYLIDLNGTQASIRAGYSEKTAYSIGSENLKKPDIQQAIAVRQKELAEKRAWDLDRLVDAAEQNLEGARESGQWSPAMRAVEWIGKATGLVSEDKQQGTAAPVTQIIINLAPGVEMPAEVVEGESRELPEGDTP